MRGAITVMLAGGLIGAPATPVLAESEAPTTASLTAQIAAGGTWVFTTRAKGRNGKPVCTESWTFNADGTSTVVSGAQTVTKTWRAEVDKDGLQWLYTTSLASTPGKDCMGEAADPADYPRPESGFVLLRFNNGVILTCQPPQWVEGPEKGKLVQFWADESCWGSIAPQAKS
jgi:hypothetical protein